ncbi:MAG: hypothetical protein JWQ14_3353 [Adhaeribacter sp.]|nr:hypothetical protein [Adhaeribacter sp.]
MPVHAKISDLTFLTGEKEIPVAASGVDLPPEIVPQPIVLSCWRSFYIIRRIRWHLFKLILGQIRDPVKAIRAM